MSRSACSEIRVRARLSTSDGDRFYSLRCTSRRPCGILAPARDGRMVRSMVMRWNDPLRMLVRRHGYGVLLTASLLVLWWGVEGPYPIQYVSNGLYIAMILIILGLEVWIPFTESWGDVRGSTRADVIYFLLAAPI